MKTLIFTRYEKLQSKLLIIAPVEIRSRIQDNKNKTVQNNNKTSGAVWLRSMVFNGKW